MRTGRVPPNLHRLNRGSNELTPEATARRRLSHVDDAAKESTGGAVRTIESTRRRNFRIMVSG